MTMEWYDLTFLQKWYLFSVFVSSGPNFDADFSAGLNPKTDTDTVLVPSSFIKIIIR